MRVGVTLCSRCEGDGCVGSLHGVQGERLFARSLLLKGVVADKSAQIRYMKVIVQNSRLFWLLTLFDLYRKLIVPSAS